MLYQTKSVSWELHQARDGKIDVDVAGDDGAGVEREAVVDHAHGEPVEELDEGVASQIARLEQIGNASRILKIEKIIKESSFRYAYVLP